MTKQRQPCLVGAGVSSRAAIGLAAILLACSDPMAGPIPGVLEILDGAPDLATPGQALRDSVRVRLRSPTGVPLGGRMITWSVDLGAGNVHPGSAMTDADGIVSARWTLGERPGLNRLSAHTLEDATVRFNTRAEGFRVERLDSDYGWACGIREGDAWCWGQNGPGAPGVSEGYEAPALHHDGDQLIDIAIGDLNYCVLEAVGTVWCGGVGFTSSTETQGVEISGLPALRQITSDDWQTYCGVAAPDSSAWCWGPSLPGTRVAGSQAFIDVKLAEPGSRWTGCGRLADSTAACWTGLGMPVPAQGGHRFAQLALGRDFACGRTSEGDVWCWGGNSSGQLGTPGPDSELPLLAASNVTRIGVATEYVMALTYGGGVERWGSASGPVVGLDDLPILEFAANDLSCVRLYDGQAYCFEELWLNRSTLDIDVYLPVPIPNGEAP